MQQQELKNWLAQLADVRSKIVESRKGPEWATRNWAAETDFLHKNLLDFGHHPEHAEAVWQLARDYVNHTYKEDDPEHQKAHSMLDHAEMKYFDSRRAGYLKGMNDHIAIPLGYMHLKVGDPSGSTWPTYNNKH